MLAGCSEHETGQMPGPTPFEVPVAEHLPATGSPSAVYEDDLPTLQRWLVSPHKVECEGFHLQQCFLMTSLEHNETRYFYNDIAEFDYQWGYKYEILISETQQESLMSDVFVQGYELIELNSQSDYQALDQFEYVARHGNKSLRKVATGTYALPGDQSVVCEPSVCESVDSAIVQDQAVLLSVQYGEQPGEPLQLVAVLCADARHAFNNTCLTNDQ